MWTTSYIVRTYHPEVPPRVEYKISALGRSARELFVNVITWGQTNLAEVHESQRQHDNPRPANQRR